MAVEGRNDLPVPCGTSLFESGGPASHAQLYQTGSEYGIPTHDTLRYTCSPNKRLRALGQLTVKPMADRLRVKLSHPEGCTG